MEIENILNQFKDYLLNSEVGDHIAKIVLFGSHAKGSAADDSDVDILIFTTNGAHIQKALMDKVYDFMIDRNVPLEILTSNIDGLFIYPDYFIYNITSYGVEIYSMEKEKIKMAMMKSIKELAEEYYESACEVLETNRIRLAVDAAYNAAELAAKVLILMKQDDLPGSHGGIVSQFGQLFVKTKELDKDLGRGLNTSLKLKNMARYRPDAVLAHDEAKDILNLANRLIEIVSEKLSHGD